MIARVPFSEKYNATAAEPNKIVCRSILMGTETGIDAFGAINTPQMIATIKGVLIPNRILISHPLFRWKPQYINDPSMANSSKKKIEIIAYWKTYMIHTPFLINR